MVKIEGSYYLLQIRGLLRSGVWLHETKRFFSSDLNLELRKGPTSRHFRQCRHAHIRETIDNYNYIHFIQCKFVCVCVLSKYNPLLVIQHSNSNKLNKSEIINRIFPGSQGNQLILIPSPSCILSREFTGHYVLIRKTGEHFINAQLWVHNAHWQAPSTCLAIKPFLLQLVFVTKSNLIYWAQHNVNWVMLLYLICDRLLSKEHLYLIRYREDMNSQ